MSGAAGDRPTRCREVQELLPWLATATLDAAERERVEAHLDGCPGCRAELERCEAERAAVRTARDLAPAPHPAQLARLFDRIERGELDDEELGEVVARPPRRSLLARTPRAVRWLIAAQIAAFAGLGLWALRADEAASPGFRTLSAGQESSAPARLRVVFAAEATESEIRALLLAAGLEIVGGPSPLGAYALAPRPGGDPRAALATLRSDPRVRFAEPVAGAPERDAARP